MKLAVMQPYLFPHIGYFQLISAADKFVCYDDVAYIKQGWINSNRLFVNGREYLFSVPIKKASSFKLIKDTAINPDLYTAWCNKFVQTLAQGYNKAPYFKEVMGLIRTATENNFRYINTLAARSILVVCTYLGIKTELLLTATGYNNSHLSSQERIIDICRKEDAAVYINAIGGQSIYSKVAFASAGIQLEFLRPEEISYDAHGTGRIANLSIIDVLMYNSPGCISRMLNRYELI